jgi:predicted DNA-binding transcriptional regulator AlpA
MSSEQLLTPEDVRKIIGLPSRHAFNAFVRRAVGFPDYILIGPKSRRWKQSEIDKWVREMKR